MPQQLAELTKLVTMSHEIASMGEALDSLRALRKLRQMLADEPAQIAAARKAGASWDEICDATGYTRTTAMKKAREGNGGVLPDVGWQWRSR